MPRSLCNPDADLQCLGLSGDNLLDDALRRTSSAPQWCAVNMYCTALAQSFTHKTHGRATAEEAAVGVLVLPKAGLGCRDADRGPDKTHAIASSRAVAQACTSLSPAATSRSMVRKNLGRGAVLVCSGYRSGAFERGGR